MKLRSKTLAVAAIVFAMNLFAANAELHVVGTDLLGLEFTKACYEFAGSHGVRLAVALDGSRPGLAELKAGRADVGLILLPPGEPVNLAEFETRPLGYQCVTIAVASTCPLERITCGELAMIFGGNDGATRTASHWGDLGADGEWTGAPITPLAPQSSLGLGADLFRQLVLDDRAFKPAVQRYASERELVSEFSRESRAMALIASLPSETAGWKILAVAKARGQPGVVATAETLHAGEYPLRLPLQIVFRRDAEAALRPFFEYLWSEEAARALERANLAALPARVRAEFLRGVRLKAKG